MIGTTLPHRRYNGQTFINQLWSIKQYSIIELFDENLYGGHSNNNPKHTPKIVKVGPL